MRPLQDVSYLTMLFVNDVIPKINTIAHLNIIAIAIKRSLIFGALALACQYASYRILRFAEQSES